MGKKNKTKSITAGTRITVGDEGMDQGHGSSSSSSGPPVVTLTPLGSAWQLPFPSRLRTKMRVVVDTSASTLNLAGVDGNAVTFVYRLNSVYQVGPLVNYPLGTAGGFAANYPSGLRYLWGADGAAGAANAPYANLTVLASAIKATVIPLSTNTAPLKLVIAPVANPATLASTSTTTQLAEQPFSMTKNVPQTMTAEPVSLKNSIPVARVFGVPRIEPQNAGYFQTAVGQPGNVAYWLVQVNNLDFSTGLTAFAISVELEYDVVLWDLNTLTTNAPA